MLLPSEAAIAAELTKRGLAVEASGPDWTADPIGWIANELGEHAWSKQREIAHALVTHRKVAVKSCHSAGKSWLAGRLCAWFLSAFPPGSARIITTAPTGDQVKGVLWQEIHHAFTTGQLPGRINQTEWWIGDYLAGIGRKPSDMNMAGFQGFHARHQLVIFDEADGMPTPLWHAADSLLASGDGYWLAIGNPYDPTSEFASVCKPGSGWAVISIPAWSTPNFTGEDVPELVARSLLTKTWVEDKRRRWTDTNPLWLSKIEAEFPEQAEDSLIPVRWIRNAQECTLRPEGPIELGVDVGGGSDRTIIAHRIGPVCRVVLDTQEPDTMVSAAAVQAEALKTKASRIKIDEIGIGRGMVDRCKELRLPVSGINVARRARDPKQFGNLRAEGFWNLREVFRQGQIDLDMEDDDVAAQLTNLKWKRRVSGIQIEPKDALRARGLPSPDRADAVMLAFLVPTTPFSEGSFMSLDDW